MGLSEEIRDAGQDLASATGATLPDMLNGAFGRFVSESFGTTSAFVVDHNRNRTATFASVVHAVREGAANSDQQAIPADSAAAVIDACEDLNLDNLRAAYERIAQAKRLKKGMARRVDGVPTTTITLGIIFALRSGFAARQHRRRA
jgi:hypothetical protein